MKILILGSEGMLGYDLVRSLRSARHEAIGAGRADLDITDPEAADCFIERIQPRLVVLTAAYTRVDDCESNRELAFAVNAEGPKNVASACRRVGARLYFLSTDYIFNGKKKTPYTENDPPEPINVYGASKLAGEKNIQDLMQDYLILRTSWLYGSRGRNFVHTILEKSQSVAELKVVDDQFGAPTSTQDLAAAIADLVDKEIGGILNVTNAGSCSWREFAQKILELNGAARATVRPISSEQFNLPATRPANSRLALDRFQRVMGYTLRPWQQALDGYLARRRK